MTVQQPHLSHPKYRPDIDGLRAVAVLAVVAFHAFPSWVRGGFIGVDVFFVISGYLISTIIFDNLDKGTFSFTEFYARRIKRIFPALLLVLIACFAFGWFALLADEYKQLGKHIAAGAGFISNFTLWNEAGYFDNSAETKPLLHLWSLGIEEQFYIVWPLLLWFAWKRKFNLLIITIVVAIASFVLNIKGIKQDMVATFYSPQTRFWELLSGSLLAWITLYKKDTFANVKLKLDYWLSRIVHSEKQEADGKTLSNVLSFIGLLLLVYGFWRINKELSFPVNWALVPVLGAVLIITAGSKAWVNRTILSNKVAVWFGLISFPLYLWHWPILSFARIVESEVPSRNIRIATVVLSILLAWLTYKLVERPIRLGKGGKAKVAILVVVMAIVGYVGYRVYVSNGLAFRLVQYSEAKTIKAEAAEKQARLNCSAYFPEWEKMNDNPCRLQNIHGNTIAIVGDSHAGHLYLGMSENVSGNGGIATFATSCAAPYLNISSATKVNDPNIKRIRENGYKLINSAFDFIVRDESIKTVILAHNPLCSMGDVKDMTNLDNKNVEKILEDGMSRTFDLLIKANKKVIVLFDNPYLPFEPSLCVSRPFRIWDKKNNCRFAKAEFESIESFSLYKSIVNTTLKNYPGVSSYDLSIPLCDGEYCYLEKNGEVLYRDRGHLNYEGSRYVAPFIMKAIGFDN